MKKSWLYLFLVRGCIGVFCVFVSLLSMAQLADSIVRVDVCIYGATSSGIMAGYTVQKSGRTAMVVEPTRHLGGLTTGGLGYTDIGNKYVISGLARDFYRRLGQQYGKFEKWVFEPHVASQTFQHYINAAKLPVVFQYRLLQSVTSGGKIIGAVFVHVETGKLLEVRAAIFIDASYEGDLMARSGVRYTVGRESNATYGETYNGVQLLDKHQFPDGIDPYRIPGDPTSGLLWGISDAALDPQGTGDSRVQAYNFRICLTNDPANKLEIGKPAGYDPEKYELVLRLIASNPNIKLRNLFKWDAIPNNKTDINNNGAFSTDMIGMNWYYADAGYEEREKFVRDLESYTKGLLYFMGHDQRVPAPIREEMLTWGYPKDEYLDNGHWSPQPYIREARRMVGSYVMTQGNCTGKLVPDDGIAYAAYNMDSHNCQRLVVKGPDGKAQVKNEGDVQIGGFTPYPISYRSLVPRREEITNLLVPVCLSASHIAYGSIRMEPVFMVLGQVSGAAAVQAAKTGSAVQDISVADLRKELSDNPLADGSVAEILVDNDRTPDLVKKSDGWMERRNSIAQFGGGYGSSSLQLDEGKQKETLSFQLPVKVTGQYQVLYYNPGSAQGKAESVEVTVQGTRNSRVTINLQKDPNDWISLGTHHFTAGKSAMLTVGGSARGMVVADAVLLLPVPTKKY